MFEGVDAIDRLSKFIIRVVHFLANLFIENRKVQIEVKSIEQRPLVPAKYLVKKSSNPNSKFNQISNWLQTGKVRLKSDETKLIKEQQA